MPRYLDLDTWPRRDLFEFYRYDGSCMMIKRALRVVILVSFLIPSGIGKGQSPANNDDTLNKIPPFEARALVTRGLALADDDRLDEAAATLKRAIAIAPNYLRAHIEYRNTKENFLGHFDEIELEYDSLIKSQPDNPVYVMAIHYLSDGSYGRSSLERVAKLAPGWAWGHYAKALLLVETKPEEAVKELLLCIEKDSSASEAYFLLIRVQQTKLKKIDAAIATAEMFAAQPELRTKGLPVLWQLRLEQANYSEEARQRLRNELQKLADTSTDLNILLLIRSAYNDLLKDPEMARMYAETIRRAHPYWYPMRGWRFSRVIVNDSGIPRYIVLANHQLAIYNQIQEAAKILDPRERIKQLEDLLDLNPNATVKRIISEDVFRIAFQANDTPRTIRNGELLYAMEPSNVSVLAKISMALAKQKSTVKKALEYARKAERATAEFRMLPKPPNIPKGFFERFFSEPKQREAYQENRAAALEALGFAHYQAGNYFQAESAFRRSVDTKRSTARVTRLAGVLRKLGRRDESNKLSAEADRELAALVSRNLLDEPSKDFPLESLQGDRRNLSVFRGRLLLINFWATWCLPCREELPALAGLHKKYKDKGLEVIGISIDENRTKVPQFVREYKLAFPIFYDNGMKDYFGARTIPTNVFIDRAGKIRYRKVGYNSESARELEAVINELIK